MSNYISVKNGRKGGRPVGDTKCKCKIPDITLVILTETQYNALLKKYGQKLLQKALVILDNWLKTSPVGFKYIGKNNYGHFRSDGWVINSAKLEM